MRVTLHSICFIITLFVIGSCDKTTIYEEKSKTLDSLSGAVNSVLKEFEKGVDTIVLEKSILRFTYYREFIHQNINDTLTKPDADNLQHFYNGGKNLLNFCDNRKVLMQRARLVNNQVLNLLKDIRGRSVEPEALLKYTASEKLEVSKLMEATYRQQKLFHESLEEFKNSLQGVELLIRSRNNGELPRIIKDTITL